MAVQERKQFQTKVGNDDFILTIGDFAEQAGGAVMVSVAESVLLVTATMSEHPREGIDFFPLSVDFEERMYAVGRIPGSFFRREGRPGERAILNARVTDRPLRPLFPDDLRNEVQVIVMPLAHDHRYELDMMSINGASAALMISDIPWEGPIGAVRIGLINDELIVNPTIAQMEESRLNLRVAASRDAIVMVECGADEVAEDVMLAALELAHESVQPILDLQEQMRAEVGKPKRDYEGAKVDALLKAQVDERVQEAISEIVRSKFDKDDRNVAMDTLRESVIAEYESIEDVAVDLKEVREAISANLKRQTRQQISAGVRPDGRKHDELRELSAEVDVLPRVHGSGLFKRGKTQVLSITTLGGPRDAQEIDDLSSTNSKRYMHHYNFPPYSTGETAFLRGPKRREIGHGALAETALAYVIPPEDQFAYTIRVVSEVLSSNGSTSMGSVCASTLSLMAAGVPIKRPVAGIAMGLIKEGETYSILTDIQGLEDHIGDMDFKVAGTVEGITALQMDIKIKGVPREVMQQALEQARIARLKILEVMLQAINAPRTDIHPNAPRMEAIKINVDKIGAVIGSGGKTIREIQESTGTTIDIAEDGTVTILGENKAMVDRAKERVRGLTEEAELGKIYSGTVTRIEPYGMFVQFMAGQDGMLHISQISSERIERIEDQFSIGDEIMVMVTDVSPDGKVRLSRQAVLENWTLEEAQSNDRGSRRGGGGGGDRRGGDRRGGDRDRRGGDRDRRGGDRS